MDVVIETDFDDPVPIYKLVLSLPFPALTLNFVLSFCLKRGKKVADTFYRRIYKKKSYNSGNIYDINKTSNFLFHLLRQQQQQYLIQVQLAHRFFLIIVIVIIGRLNFSFTKRGSGIFFSRVRLRVSTPPDGFIHVNYVRVDSSLILSLHIKIEKIEFTSFHEYL